MRSAPVQYPIRRSSFPSAKDSRWLAELKKLRRGQVVRVLLGGAEGRELRGPHYGAIVSNDTVNAALPTIVVVPLGTHEGTGIVRKYEVKIEHGDGGLPKDGCAIPCQIRTLDRVERVVEIWDSLDAETLDEIIAMLEVITNPTEAEASGRP